MIFNPNKITISKTGACTFKFGILQSHYFNY